MWSPTLPILSALTLATAQNSWPTQSYKTEPFIAPQLDIKKSGATEPGYLFFGPSGNTTNYAAPLIMTDDGELVWRGPDLEQQNPTNFRVQTHTPKRISYWSGFG